MSCLAMAGWLTFSLLSAPPASSLLADTCGVSNVEFDAGLAQLQAYNYDAALVHFARGAEQDADCTLCVWGLGLAQITLHDANGTPYPHDLAPRLAAAQTQAQTQSHPLATALLGAVHDWLADTPPWPQRQQAYLDRLRKLEAAYPQQPDLQFLLANALLGQVMQSCHAPSGMLEDDAELLQLLERGLAESPRHAGLHHLMIHATERSPHPERGLPSAELLPQLEPDKGHMVHMPGHTYLRLGRYAEAAAANRAAIAVDDVFLSTVQDAGLYYDFLVLHNHHFLWFALLMQQDFAAARVEAAKLVAMIRPQTHKIPTQVQFLASAPVITAIRMGEAVAVDPQSGPYVQVLAYLANGLVAARAGDGLTAQAHAEALAAKLPELAFLHLHAMGLMAQGLLTAELALASGAWAAAETAYTAAIALEDVLPYMEPWAWQLPVREFYAAALITRGAPAQAQAVCDEELHRHPHSPYAQSLRALATAGL